MRSRTMFWLVALGLSAILVPVSSSAYFGIFFYTITANSTVLWLAGAATGIGLSFLLSWLFRKFGRQAILPIMNGIFTFIVIAQVYFWSIAFFPSNTSLFFGLASTAFLVAVLIASFHKNLAAPIWVLCHESINAAALIIVNFSWLYWNQSSENAACMNEILTRTDSVYFTLTTLATVGYGDIHPVSEACRKSVSAQILISLIFVVVILALLVSRIGQRLSPSPDEHEIGHYLSDIRRDIDSLSDKLNELEASLNTSQGQIRRASPKRWRSAASAGRFLAHSPLARKARERPRNGRPRWYP